MAKRKPKKPPHEPVAQDNLPIPEEIATTWEHVVSAISRAQDTEGMVFFHRGHSNSTWDLKPSLLRLFNELELRGPAAIEVEQDSLDNFKRRARLWLRSELLPPENATALAWWPLMQHFSTPTRLLDWTRSPWVALYFAINHHFEIDGVIWSFLPSPLLREKDRDWRRFAKGPLSATQKDNVFVIEEIMPTERLEAQQGVFTVATSPLLSQDEYLPCLRRLVIRASIKQECLFRLKAMNITATSLFPGLDGLGRGVAEGMRLVSWTRANHNKRILAICQNIHRSVSRYMPSDDSAQP